HDRQQQPEPAAEPLPLSGSNFDKKPRLVRGFFMAPAPLKWAVGISGDRGDRARRAQRSSSRDPAPRRFRFQRRGRGGCAEGAEGSEYLRDLRETSASSALKPSRNRVGLNQVMKALRAPHPPDPRLSPRSPFRGGFASKALGDHVGLGGLGAAGGRLGVAHGGEVAAQALEQRGLGAALEQLGDEAAA